MHCWILIGQAGTYLSPVIGIGRLEPAARHLGEWDEMSTAASLMIRVHTSSHGWGGREAVDERCNQAGDRSLVPLRIAGRLREHKAEACECTAR